MFPTVSRRFLTLTRRQAVHDAIADAFGCRPGAIAEVLFGDDAVQFGERFEEWGIEVTAAEQQ